MATVTVGGVPPVLVRRLAAAAAANGRRLEVEIIERLSRGVNDGDSIRAEHTGWGGPAAERDAGGGRRRPRPG